MPSETFTERLPGQTAPCAPNGGAPEPSGSSGARQAPRLRLEFLDGLRGLAALYVVLFHATSFVLDHPASAPVNLLARCMAYGHYAVVVFIVLSGYCLMLPVACSTKGALPWSFSEYVRRRARRILPPYYAALFFSLLLVGAGVLLQRSSSVQGSAINECFTPGILLSHLFLVHNLDFVWAHRINSPMWTVATEWQIYFLFPALLLPLWRRFGNFATVACATVVGLLPAFLLPEQRNFYWAGPWFVGLFAMGMAGASLSFGKDAEKSRWLGCLRSPITPLLLTLAAVALHLVWKNAPLWPYDLVIGVATFSLIVYLAQFVRPEEAGKAPLLLRVLQSRYVVALGAFSYSLYLVHYPLQQAMLRVLQTLAGSAELIVAIQLLVGVPLIVASAYVFHLFFERPFMNTPRRAAARASAPAPAPVGRLEVEPS